MYMFITKTLAMQYTEIFLALQIENFQLNNFEIFLIFCSKHRLWVHVRRGGSNEYQQFMFWSKIIKIGMPLHTPVLRYKIRVQGVYITRACFHDGKKHKFISMIFLFHFLFVIK